MDLWIYTTVFYSILVTITISFMYSTFLIFSEDDRFNYLLLSVLLFCADMYMLAAMEVR